MIDPRNLIPWRIARRWRCVRCGWCCCNYDVPITFEDEERLRKFGDVFWHGKVGVYLKRIDGKCIFYRDGECLIYEDRPIACRMYPFYIRRQGDELAKFGDVYVYLDRNCRGIGKGSKIEEVLNLLLLSKTQLGFDNPHIVF